ncbi:MAG: GLPGLI family protein [Bacteroidetes bacterium]|nr:GLPGLI family protein [Bacteroidota bacterium]MCY4204698.1 GLPGLI family protein [Bacteroidota bacterium]
MKSISLLLLTPFLLTPVLSFAQEEGVAQYSHTFEILYGKDGADAVIEIVKRQNGEDPLPPGPGFATVSRTLTFNSTTSLFHTTEIQSFEIGERSNWEYIDTTFVDFKKGDYSQWVEFNADAYLIKDQLPEFSWRLTNETRTYLDYRVMKATALVDSSIVEAWFTPDIPVSAGPGLYSGLPGLILMATNEATGEVYSAELVDLKARSNIAAPSTGRAISAKKYHQIKKSEMEKSRRIYDKLMREREERGYAP